MANDRMYALCTVCGERVFVGKSMGLGFYFDGENLAAMADFMAEHSELCSQVEGSIRLVYEHTPQAVKTRVLVVNDADNLIQPCWQCGADNLLVMYEWSSQAVNVEESNWCAVSVVCNQCGNTYGRETFWRSRIEASGEPWDAWMLAGKVVALWNTESRFYRKVTES